MAHYMNIGKKEGSLTLTNYSYLNASTVLIFDALIAGITPEIAPVTIAKARHPAKSHNEYLGAKKLQPRPIKTSFAAYVIAKPANIPRVPAISPRKEDSNKKMSKISEFFAPIAFKIPISL